MTMTRTKLVTRTESRVVTNVTIVVDYAPRCVACKRPLAVQATRPWILMCSDRHCKVVNHGNTETK